MDFVWKQDVCRQFLCVSEDFFVSQTPSFTNNQINNPTVQILLERVGKKLLTVLIDLSLSTKFDSGPEYQQVARDNKQDKMRSYLEIQCCCAYCISWQRIQTGGRICKCIICKRSSVPKKV